MVEVLRRHDEAQPHVLEAELAVRVGIHTGLVIVEATGEAETQAPLVVGEPPRMATGIRELAEPDAIVISEATVQLVAGYFEIKPLGDQRLAGHPAPLALYEVRGENALQTRLEVEVARGLTPFVGREAELALLGQRWAEVQEGRGQMIVISGDAGIGKSRLVDMLRDQVAKPPHVWLECRCSPHDQNVALYPVKELVHQLLGTSSMHAIEEKLSAIEALLQHHRLPVEETAPLLANLLSLRMPDGRYPQLTSPPNVNDNKP